jgi:hypothetical protein
MNKSLLLMLVLTLMMNGLANAQSGTQAVNTPRNHNYFTLDVGTPKSNSMQGSISGNKLQARTTELISMQLLHLNPFRYKYKLSGTAIDLFNDMPVITDTFNKSTTATASDANLKPAGAVTSNVKEQAEQALANTTGLTKNDAQKVKTLKSTITKTSGIENILAEVKKQDKADNSPAFNALLDKVKVSLTENSAVVNTIEELDKTIINSYHKTDSLDKLIKADTARDSVAAQTAAPSVSRTNLSTLIAPIEKGATYNEQLIAIWEKLLLSVDVNLCQIQGIQDKMASYLMYMKTIDNFDKNIFKKYRDGYRETISSTVAEYNRIINDFNSRPFIDTLGKFKILQAKTAQYTEVKAECDKMLAQFYSVNLNSYLLPIDVNGKNIDLVEFKLERLNPVTDVKIDEYKYQIWIKGGFKFDFSVGGFLTSLNNQKFITEDVTDNGVTKKKILRDSEGLLKLGFGTMGNMSLRMGASWLRPGLSLGVIFTTAETFQILTGPSLIIGKMERIVLHTGLSMGSVSQLRPEYKEHEAYDLGTSNTVPTVKIFKAGFFFGLTYNLTKVKSAGVNMNK